MRQNKYEYDAFISHAVEDKIPIANELCAALERAGLRIWYSGKELGVGDSIEKTIEKGLNRSRYGIVILSPTYLAKNWTIREFYTLLAKEIEEQKVILPVLYNITVDELKDKDLLMADRFAVSTDRGIDYVVDRLVREIRKPQKPKPQPAWLSRLWTVLVLSLLANVAFLLKDTMFSGHASGALSRPMEINGASAVPTAGSIDPAFLGQIEGIFNQLSACTCSHHQRGQSVPVRTVSYTEGNGGSTAQSANVWHTGSQAGQATRKMTMAVVFQVETGQPAPPPTPGDAENAAGGATDDEELFPHYLQTASLDQ